MGTKEKLVRKAKIRYNDPCYTLCGLAITFIIPAYPKATRVRNAISASRKENFFWQLVTKNEVSGSPEVTDAV